METVNCVLSIHLQMCSAMLCEVEFVQIGAEKCYVQIGIRWVGCIIGSLHRRAVQCRVTCRME